MLFKDKNGLRTRVTQTNHDSYHFEVYRFQLGTGEKVEVNQYTKTGVDAESRIAVLSVADSIRFAEQYGMGPDRVTHLQSAADLEDVVASHLRFLAANRHDHASGAAECTACGLEEAANTIDPNAP